jgi:hypothetical protein
MLQHLFEWLWLSLKVLSGSQPKTSFSFLDFVVGIMSDFFNFLSD